MSDNNNVANQRIKNLQHQNKKLIIGVRLTRLALEGQLFRDEKHKTYPHFKDDDLKALVNNLHDLEENEVTL